MAKKSSPLEDFIYLASKLPWWVCAPLALASGMWLHSIASTPVPTAFDPRHLNATLTASVFRSMAMLGQFVVPLIFVGGVVASIAGRIKRRKVLNSVMTPGGNTLLSISWREFEWVVGEALRRRGYAVQETGASGPDGGIDLIARKDGEKYVVQCKQWRSVQVGVPVVRELYGAMAAEGAVGGLVVTSGTFTKPAREFASGRNVQLVDGSALQQWIDETKKPTSAPTAKVVVKPVESEIREPVLITPSVERPAPTPAPELRATSEAPSCPHCKKPMVIKLARTGKNAGGNFWGCGDYPKCRGIRPIFAPITMK